jgi:hypothetical protein
MQSKKIEGHRERESMGKRIRMPRIVGAAALVIALTFVVAVLCYVGWGLLPTTNPLAQLA